MNLQTTSAGGACLLGSFSLSGGDNRLVARMTAGKSCHVINLFGAFVAQLVYTILYHTRAG